jgi:hypothetical protein
MPQPNLTALLYATRILTILWAGFWSWFGLAGGIVLFATGVAVSIAYQIMFARVPVHARNFLLLTMAAPPLACGILLLWRAWLQRDASHPV